MTCPNQDVVYGPGFFGLDTRPKLAQLPVFASLLFATRAPSSSASLESPMTRNPGFYLIAGPGSEREVPEDVTDVIRSSTSLANTIPRVFMDNADHDRAAIQGTVVQVVFYPLDQFDGSMKTIDWSDAPTSPSPSGDSDGGEPGISIWITMRMAITRTGPNRILSHLPRERSRP